VLGRKGACKNANGVGTHQLGHAAFAHGEWVTGVQALRNGELVPNREALCVPRERRKHLVPTEVGGMNESGDEQLDISPRHIGVAKGPDEIQGREWQRSEEDELRGRKDYARPRHRARHGAVVHLI
jgi:hypothetical protein